MRKFKDSTEFQWDKGNHNKNWIRHKITNKECEEAFFDPDRKIYKDDLHSKTEKRYVLLGRTRMGRLLFVSFIKRGKKVRVISARVLDYKKVRNYYK